MATGRPPFRAQNLKNLIKVISQGQYPPIPEHYSADLSLIINNLLQVVSLISKTYSGGSPSQTQL